MLFLHLMRVKIISFIFYSYGELLHSLSDVPEFREFDPASASVQEYDDQVSNSQSDIFEQRYLIVFLNIF